MKLSEAIRLGSLLKPQTFNQWDLDGSCALGAAADAVGIPRRIGMKYDSSVVPCIDYGALRERFPLPWVLCPACNEDLSTYSTPHAVIYHLNDTHRWTRERIADFVAMVEAGMDSEISVTQEEHISK